MEDDIDLLPNRVGPMQKDPPDPERWGLRIFSRPNAGRSIVLSVRRSKSLLVVRKNVFRLGRAQLRRRQSPARDTVYALEARLDFSRRIGN